MRSEKFLPDGKRAKVSPTDVQDAVARAAPGTPVALSYFIGTALHESSFTVNELDTEDSGFQSLGIFQLSADEAKQAGEPAANLYDLDTSVRVLAAVSEARLAKLADAAGVQAPYPDDIWAYLAFAHNQGLAAAVKSINTYGLDWEAFKGRPQNAVTQRLFKYGDDCISGGNLATIAVAEVIGGNPVALIAVLVLTAGLLLGALAMGGVLG